MSGLIVDAVTGILIHEDAVFMIRRNPALMAFPGYAAFPGGKVDPEDADGPSFSEPELRNFDARLIRGLVRELREEISFDLVSAIADGLVVSVSLCGQALTPPHVPRRFDTSFFIIRLRHRPLVALEPSEVVDSGWAPPSEWLRIWRAGECIMAPPTLACLEMLETDPQCQTTRARDIESWSRSGMDTSHGDAIPVMQSVHGLKQLFVRSNTLPPAEHTNCYVIGDSDGITVAVDPSPRDEIELARLERSLLRLGVNRILLTHHHRDHRQFADVLGRRHGWPVLMSPRTEARIRSHEPEFLQRLQVQLCDEGDVICHWLGHPVRVLAIPGHDDGQLAPMPDNGAWCIVGDLIQGVGTVVISKPEGNMGRYFESLERIIALDPVHIFPSHGVGLGTTFRLQETLRHRQQREAKILELRLSGLEPGAILEAVYQDIDPRLLPYALRNIESHLDKLIEESRLPA